jgi:hypothetical protein
MLIGANLTAKTAPPWLKLLILYQIQIISRISTAVPLD